MEGGAGPNLNHSRIAHASHLRQWYLRFHNNTKSDQQRFDRGNKQMEQIVNVPAIIQWPFKGECRKNNRCVNIYVKMCLRRQKQNSYHNNIKMILFHLVNLLTDSPISYNIHCSFSLLILLHLPVGHCLAPYSSLSQFYVIFESITWFSMVHGAAIAIV